MWFQNSRIPKKVKTKALGCGCANLEKNLQNPGFFDNSSQKTQMIYFTLTKGRLNAEVKCY